MAARWYLTPVEAAAHMHWDPQYLRIVAKKKPDELPFPIVRHGNRTQIPKASFYEWLEKNQKARYCDVS